jgi:hypothetical protein
MTLGWPQSAVNFFQLYARMEGALKQTGHVKQGRKLAQADWASLAKSLGPKFFHYVRDAQMAETLIAEPPRKRMSAGSKWLPDQPPPIQTTEELFRRGVCQVRHNLAHGEKFNVTGDGWERDLTLVTQSLWVLEQAVERHQGFRGLTQSDVEGREHTA